MTPWTVAHQASPSMGFSRQEYWSGLPIPSLIQYIKNSKNTIRKLLELISEFSKVTGCKINPQKSLAFLYNNKEKSEREIKQSIPLTIATKRIKCLGINLPKEIKELYAENSKTLLKEIKDNINRWTDIPCSWVRRINILKMAILPNVIL